MYLRYLVGGVSFLLDSCCADRRTERRTSHI